MVSLRAVRLNGLVCVAALLFSITPGLAAAQSLPPIVEPGTAQPPADTGAEPPTADTGGPVRMAHLSLAEGDVRLGQEGSNNWSQASINLLLSVHNSLYTASNSRAEIRFDDGSMLRMAPGASVTIQVLFSDLDGEYTEIQVAQGTVTMRTADRSSVVQLDSPLFAVRTAGPSEIRLDVTDRCSVGALVGMAQIEGPAGTSPVTMGSRATATESGGNVHVAMAAVGAPDAWDQWNIERDRQLDGDAQDEGADLPPDVVVAQPDMGAYGEWGAITGLGHVWYPHVPAGWRPYAYGHWVWVNPYGLIWVSSEPWGWATYHYGTWLKTSHGWGWVPGPANQYWSPAVVNMRERDGVVIWAPLAPREVHYPPTFTVGRPGSAWVTRYSVPRCAVYYPVSSSVCEGRPWSTLDIIKSQQQASNAASGVVITPNHNTALRSDAFIPMNGYSGGASRATIEAVQNGGKNEPVPADQYADTVDSHSVGAPASGPPMLAPIGFHPAMVYVGQIPGRSVPVPMHPVVVQGKTVLQPVHTSTPEVGRPRSGPTVPGRSEPHPGGSQSSGGGSHGGGNSGGGGGSHSGDGGGGHSGGGNSGGGGGGHNGKN